MKRKLSEIFSPSQVKKMKIRRKERDDEDEHAAFRPPGKGQFALTATEQSEIVSIFSLFSYYDFF